MYAEISPTVDTGVAIANPNSVAANLTFVFTGQDGVQFGSGSISIPANGQISAFLDQPPFNGGSSLQGTFSFTSDVPVGAIALRGFINERSEFLWTTLPVIDTGKVSSNPTFPSFADGGGWSTEFVLVNPTKTALTGNLQFLPSAASSSLQTSPASLTVNGQTGNKFLFSIPAGSAVKLQTSGNGNSTQVGFVSINPDPGSVSPGGVAIFSQRNLSGITISQAGVPATAATTTAIRMYAENSTDSSQIQTGIAIANPSSTNATATLQLTTLSGQSTGLSATIPVPANTEVQMFLNQIQGFQSLGTFKGVLRITSGFNQLAVVGLRSRYNERQEFLITTTAPVIESYYSSSPAYLFPRFADGGGFTTQFILFNASSGQTTGVIRFNNQSGQAITPVLK